MTALAQNFELGENIGTLTITPQTRAADGTLTNGTSWSMLGVLTSFKERRQISLDDSSITPSAYENNTPYQSGTSYDISGKIMRNDATGTINKTGEIFDSFSYVKMVRVRAGRTTTFWGTFENYEEDAPDKKSINFSTTLRMIDIGGPNPVYS